MDAQGKPATVTELYPPKWLKAEHLQGRAVTVKITAAIVEDFRQVDGQMKPALVLSFEGKRLRLICGKTQVHDAMMAIGSERFADWPGHLLTLAPAVATNGKPTIAISAAQASDGGQ